MVLSRVTKAFFSITIPVTSPVLIQSLTWKGLIYVITNPATALATAEDEPIEIKIPKNTETPLKASEPEPGRYGKMIITTKIKNTNRTIEYVGCAHSLWKFLMTKFSISTSEPLYSKNIKTYRALMTI